MNIGNYHLSPIKSGTNHPMGHLRPLAPARNFVGMNSLCFGLPSFVALLPIGMERFCYKERKCLINTRFGFHFRGFSRLYPLIYLKVIATKDLAPISPVELKALLGTLTRKGGKDK